MNEEKLNEFYKTEGIVFETVAEHEPYFSWAHCETCDSSFAGYRNEVIFMRQDLSQIEAAICDDCLEFIFNPQER